MLSAFSVLALVTLFVDSAFANSHSTPVASAIERAGDNAPEIERALAEVADDQRASMEWLVAHMPDADLARLDAAFLLAHVDGAHGAWTSAPWHAMVDEELYRDAILPYASVSESRELWVRSLREQCLPMVESAETPAEAAVILNQRIFAELGVRYSTSRARADQSVSESIASGKATCTGLSVLLINACRSVGVPARFVGVPMWIDGSGNHSWVEIFDGERWRFTGAAEPTGDRLDEGWFTHRVREQLGHGPRHAIYAITWRRTGVEFPMRFDSSRPRARAIDVTERYAASVPSIAEGMMVLRISLRDAVEGVRVRRAVEIVDATGTVIASGTTKDERFDLNDDLELTVPHDGERRFRVDGADVEDVTIRSTTETGMRIVLTLPPTN